LFHEPDKRQEKKTSIERLPAEAKEAAFVQTYGKNLKACGTKAAAVKAFFISSSETLGL
jgi:hypothetical protein